MKNYTLMPEVPTKELLNVIADGIYNDLATKIIYQYLYAAAPQVEHELSDWRIDTSTGTNILVYKDCSVIEDAQAKFLMHLLSSPQSKLTEMLMGIDEVDTTPSESDTLSEKLLKYLIQDYRDLQEKATGEPYAWLVHEAGGTFLTQDSEFIERVKDDDAFKAYELFTYQPDAQAKISELEAEKSALVAAQFNNLLAINELEANKAELEKKVNHLESNHSHLIKQVDYLIVKLGLTEEQAWTEGGSLNAPRICNHVQETLIALEEANSKVAHLLAGRKGTEYD